MDFNKLSDLFWRSSSAGGDYFHIVLYSLVSAGIFLLIFKICSNQDRIRRHKRKIVGYILQIGLYKDRPRVVFSSALHVLKHNLLYLRCALPSLAILMAPALLVSTQINNRCGYAPLDHGESFIVAVQLDDAHLSAAGPGALERVSCAASPGVIIETPPLRVPGEKLIFWRARVASPRVASPRVALPRVALPGRGGNEYIEIIAGERGTAAVKKIATEKRGERFSPRLEKWRAPSALLFNAEGFLNDDSPVSSISVGYRRAAHPFLFMDVDALVLYFLLTVGFALVLKPLFNVSM